MAGIDYEHLNTTITFEKDDLVARIRVKVIDNQILQEMRTFGAIIEVVQGEFPAFVQNNTASIVIEEDDSEWHYSTVCALVVM